MPVYNKEPLITHRSSGEDFLYVFKPGRHGPDAPPLHPAMHSLPLRSASAPGGWRATRLPNVHQQWLRPGEGGADCAESPPQRQAR